MGDLMCFISLNRLISLYVIIVLALNKGLFAFQGKSVEASYHTIQITSLFPSSSCNSSSFKEVNKKTSLEVVHKHGPCYQLKQQDKTNTSKPTQEQILQEDEIRVKSINSRLSKSNVKQTDSTKLPVNNGISFGSGNYVVTIGLGTPKKQLSLIFDTGSHITWTQCEPCAKYCYSQTEPRFDPSHSTSYSNVSCNKPGCASSTCVYGIQYGDSSYTVGFFAKETLTLTPTDTFTNFFFGCGQNNRGTFGKAAGLLGLGRDPLSFVSQTARKYKKLFSYCLPSSSSASGFLTFGTTQSKSPKFTQISNFQASPSLYGVNIVGITLAGKKLAISPSTFVATGAIIDSGTVITRLPQAAYAALKAGFRQMMSKYPTTKALLILDTCYDLSGYDSIQVPKIGLLFSGGLEVDIDASGILFGTSLKQVCLGFAANSDETDVAIIGYLQQKTYEVVYDGLNGRLGFAPGACS